SACESSVMHRHQAVAPSRSMHECRAQSRLEVIEAPPQRQQRRVHSRMRRVVAKQSGQDEVARGHGLGSLGKKQDEGGLLLSQACLPFPELHGSPRRVELEPAETIAAGTAGAAL